MRSECAQLLSRVGLSAAPWTIAYQAPLSMEFSRQEYWSELPFLLQRILLTQGLNLHLLYWQADSLTLADVSSFKLYTYWILFVKWASLVA